MLLDLPELEEAGFIFTDRGSPIPADRRSLWRLATILLLLDLGSRGKKASLVRLHVLDWALRSSDSRLQLQQFLNDHSQRVFVRYDPSLLRAIRLGVGVGLLEIDGKNIRLTSEGELFASELRESNILDDERRYSTEVAKHLSETLVNQLAPQPESRR